MKTKQIWTQVKEEYVSSTNEVCECAKVGSKNVNSEWWNEAAIKWQKVKPKKCLFQYKVH